MDTSRYNTIEELREATINCRRCGLRQGCTQVVPGEGRASAQVMFVGEAPGANEDEEGSPFVGRSGKLLRKIIQDSGFDIDSQVYITNTAKCRPPDNRDPVQSEINACKPWLWEEMLFIKPKIIFCVGKVPTRTLFSITKKILKLKDYAGEFYKMPWPEEKFNGLLMPIYHPSYLLRSPSKISDETKWIEKGYSYAIKNENHIKFRLP